MSLSSGSTLVMRAITSDDEVQLKKAMAVAPRGKRASQLLNLSVGTLSISPLYWAIETGSLQVARAMIEAGSAKSL